MEPANTLATAAVNVGLNVALIPAYGMLGAAIAFASSTLVQNGLPLFQIWKDLDMHPFSRSMALAVTGALCCFGVLGVLTYAALGYTYPALALFLALASIAYLAFLLRMRGELLLDEFWAGLGAIRGGARRAPESVPARSRRPPRAKGQVGRSGVAPGSSV